MRRVLGAFALALALLAGPAAAQPAPEEPAAPEQPDGPAAEPQEVPAPAPEPAAEPAPAAEGDWSDAFVDRVDDLLDRQQAGSAAVECDQLRAELDRDHATAPLAVREACARAHVALADLLADLGDPRQAHAHLRRAAGWDPRLLDDPDFVARMKGDRARPAPVAPQPPEPRRERRPAPRREPAPQPEPHPEPEPEPTRPDGPRAGRGVGVGLGGGFDGVLGLTVGWMHRELISVEVGVGLLFPVLDSRVRIYGLRHPLTPVLGLGMTTPLSASGRWGVEAESYSELYDLGESVHVDVGLSWAPWRGLDVFAGVAFVTTVDQEHPDRLFFFPQLAAQALWYF